MTASRNFNDISADEYLRGTYSRRTAKEIGHENLTKPHIAALLKEAQNRLAIRTETSAEWVVRRLQENHQQARDSGDIAQSNRALELIGKHLGMFSNKAQENTRTTYHVITGISGAPGSKKRDGKRESA